MKQHLAGGTLRIVMVEEIKRVLAAYADVPQSIDRAAIHLGITPRTLRIWIGQVSKGGWEELQPDISGTVDRVLSATQGKKKGKKKKNSCSPHAQ